VSDTPPSRGVRIAIFLRFGHLRTTQFGDVCEWEGKGGFYQTDIVGQGGSNKSLFARTSLMDDPLV